MKSESRASAAQPSPDTLILGGGWTARGLGSVPAQLDTFQFAAHATRQVDATGIDALDTAGAWVLHKLLTRMRTNGADVTLQGLHPEHARLLQVVTEHEEEQARGPAPAATPAAPNMLEQVGRNAEQVTAARYFAIGYPGRAQKAEVSLLHQVVGQRRITRDSREVGP